MTWISKQINLILFYNGKQVLILISISNVVVVNGTVMEQKVKVEVEEVVIVILVVQKEIMTYYVEKMVVKML